ncbi:MAG: divalent metal cation transporter [Candidatus Dadabacteria bacterium]|nr:divalent metal cation transporter [Candidatus Dadabacteria bacterium]
MDLSESRTQGIMKSLGPSLLWAGAAIGVSHLVQSTRAGAGYEFALVWAVILANLLKYPFFEFGPRYAAATGESLLAGYKRLGKVAFGIYIVITITTMFTIIAAVTIVTASLVAGVFKPVVELSPVTWSAILLVICAVILVLGQYSVLDGLTKFIIVALSISTVVAVVAAVGHGSSARPDFIPPAIMTKAGIAFIIALMGWMPSPVELSVWTSIWTLERKKQTGHTPKLREALFDFNLAYFITAFLAICFVTLGAMVMYGTGEQFSRKGTVFAAQFISLYTQTLGAWSYPVIVIMAIATMFSTTLTCTDAYSRVLKRSTELIVPAADKWADNKRLYWVWLVVVIVGGVLLITLLKRSMTFMIDLATTLSFLTAPVLAGINYWLVTSRHMPKEAVPPMWLRALSILGISFLTGFGIIYIWSNFFDGI